MEQLQHPNSAHNQASAAYRHWFSLYGTGDVPPIVIEEILQEKVDWPIQVITSPGAKKGGYDMMMCVMASTPSLNLRKRYRVRRRQVLLKKLNEF
jgi:hypothetical protein